MRSRTRSGLVWLGLAVTLVSTAALVRGCVQRRPGNAETDRVARVVGLAVGYPHQTSADGFLAATLRTRAAQDGRLTVVQVERIPADRLTEPTTRMTFRIHLESSEAGWIATQPVTACYDLRFSFYGEIGEPERIDCPPDADPLTTVPGPPVPGPQAPPEPDNPLHPSD